MRTATAPRLHFREKRGRWDDSGDFFISYKLMHAAKICTFREAEFTFLYALQ